MRLFFLRHGAAQPGNSQLHDFDRPLTPSGRSELDAIALGLRRIKVAPDTILSSPLVRARETAEIVAPVLGGKLEIVDELSSGADFDAFRRLIGRYSSAHALMFVGHEPDFSDAAAALIGAHAAAIVLKKAGAIRIDLEGRAEAGRGRLRWLLTPSQLVLIGGAASDGEDEA